MKNSIGLFVAALFFVACSFAPKKTENRIELKYESVIDLKIDALEISGLTKINNRLFFVSDNPEDTKIYEVTKSGTRTYIDFQKLKGFSSYEKEISQFKSKTKFLFDLEGMASCGETFYLANERLRHILKITKTSFEKLPINFENQKKLLEGFDNKGFEGLGVDCKNQKLYLAKERSPRKILVVDLKTNKLIDSFNIELSDRQNQRSINIFTLNGLMEVSPDYAGLAVYKDSLYVLERNAYEVTQLDLKTKKIIKRFSFIKDARMFQSKEPFGLAEALYVDENSFYIGFDNNWKYRTQEAVEKYKIPYNEQGFILKFKKQN